MTQVWDDQNRPPGHRRPGRAVPGGAGRRRLSSDGYSAVQVTFGAVKPSRLNKPEAGSLRQGRGRAGKRLVELRVDDAGQYEVGQEINAAMLSAGEKVDVTGVSKGKGFAGVMKRHNFKGLGAGHGTHKKHRAPGAIGACATPARVFKGTQDGRAHGPRAGDHPEPRGRAGRRRAPDHPRSRAPFPGPGAGSS